MATEGRSAVNCRDATEHADTLRASYAQELIPLQASDGATWGHCMSAPKAPPKKEKQAVITEAQLERGLKVTAGSHLKLTIGKRKFIFSG